jgi:acyl-CoA synthetase (NDP forming)
MDRFQLARMLAPKSVAVVGASERLAMSNNAVLPMLEAGLEVRLVNPTSELVYGQRTYPDLTAVGEAVDAVLALVNAERAVAVVEEAARLGCGGVVVAAAGFAEAGEQGAGLAARLAAAAEAGGLAVVGPNCSGFVNVPLGVNLFTGGRLALRPGGVAVVSQSGFLVRSALAAGIERRLGISVAVSSGNETVCDLADYVDVLADDPATTVICLVVETVRRPADFFAAVHRARDAGKPVIALKLGRSDAARRIMQSHTGAIADESWVYDVAFREHGVLQAGDVDELLDKAQLFAQLPRDTWRSMRRIGMITSSGGVAALATDQLPADLELPQLGELRDYVAEVVPASEGLNPLDMTGFVVTRRELTEELFTRYAEATSIDVLVLCWWLGQGDESWSRTLLDPFAAVANAVAKPLVVTPLEATGVGDWVDAHRRGRMAFTRGVASAYRALAALSDFVETVPRLVDGPPAAGAVAAPEDLVDTPVGRMLPFGAAMRLLESCGLAVAPHAVLSGDDERLPAGVDLGARLAVKLADVPHRTELGAVRLSVTPDELPGEVRRLREVARAERLPTDVAVQRMVSGHGEAFVGLHGTSALGPLVLFGRGGVLVEAGGGVSGRLLPLDHAAAQALVEEVAGQAAFARLRGHRPWAPGPMVDALLAVSELWRRTGSWVGSVDINPLVVTTEGVCAVDALVVAAE